MKIKIEERKGKPYKIISTRNEDFKIELSAYENEGDEFAFDEPSGDVVEESYSPQDFKKALKDYIKYLDKGYDDVTLSLVAEGPEGRVTIRLSDLGVSAFASIPLEDESQLSKCEEKLAKIKEILNE